MALANGKRFDPAPLGVAILADCAGVLCDIFVLGAGREAAGALLFPISAGATASGVVETAWPSIQALGETSPSHARRARHMLVVPSPGESDGLPVSSKGAIMRRPAEERHGDAIDKAYDNGPDICLTAAAPCPPTSYTTAAPAAAWWSMCRNSDGREAEPCPTDMMASC